MGRFTEGQGCSSFRDTLSNCTHLNRRKIPAITRLERESNLDFLVSLAFRIDALVTNFHTPKSTLLLLVSAFIGGGPQSLFGIYNQAIESKYRFLSYGDSSVYFRDTMVK